MDCNWDSIQFPGLSSAFQIVPCNVKGLVVECKRISIEIQMTLFEYQSNYSECQFIMDFKGFPLSFHWFHGLSSKFQTISSKMNTMFLHKFIDVQRISVQVQRIANDPIEFQRVSVAVYWTSKGLAQTSRRWFLIICNDFVL